MIHLKTIALVIALVLAAWLFGLPPAQAQIVSGGSGGGSCGPSHWANLPSSPPMGTCFFIPDSASCTAGTAVTTSGSTPCQLTWTGSNWLPAGNVVSSAAGGLTTAGNNLTAVGSTVSVNPPITVANGGTGATSAGATAAHNIGAAAEGANSDITSLTGLTTPLSVAQGGSGTATPGLVAGTNVTITGSWPNQTVNSSGGATAPNITALVAAQTVVAFGGI